MRFNSREPLMTTLKSLYSLVLHLYSTSVLHLSMSGLYQYASMYIAIEVTQ
jgi:hypothetical protein